jgi:hypothetical protein
MLWVSCVAADAARETTLATIRSTTYTAAERPHAWDVHGTAITTHKDVTHAVESRLPYIRRFKGTRALTGEERVAERLTYFEFVDTQAADGNTKGINGLFAAREYGLIEVILRGRKGSSRSDT